VADASRGDDALYRDVAGKISWSGGDAIAQVLLEDELRRRGGRVQDTLLDDLAHLR